METFEPRMIFLFFSFPFSLWNKRTLITISGLMTLLISLPVCVLPFHLCANTFVCAIFPLHVSNKHWPIYYIIPLLSFLKNLKFHRASMLNLLDYILLLYRQPRIFLCLSYLFRLNYLNSDYIFDKYKIMFLKFFAILFSKILV